MKRERAICPTRMTVASSITVRSANQPTLPLMLGISLPSIKRRVRSVSLRVALSCSSNHRAANIRERATNRFPLPRQTRDIVFVIAGARRGRDPVRFAARLRSIRMTMSASRSIASSCLNFTVQHPRAAPPPYPWSAQAVRIEVAAVATVATILAAAIIVDIALQSTQTTHAGASPRSLLRVDELELHVLVGLIGDVGGRLDVPHHANAPSARARSVVASSMSQNWSSAAARIA